MTNSSTKSEFALIVVQKNRFAATGVLFSMSLVEKIDNGDIGFSSLR
ncbi:MULTISPECIES: hypothetical protein [unclassified Paenibacillus]